MLLLTVLLAFFFVLGGVQFVMAGWLADKIQGGPGKRGSRGRKLDVLVLRAAGGFVAVLAGAALLFVVFAENAV
jgi:MFS family permease